METRMRKVGLVCESGGKLVISVGDGVEVEDKKNGLYFIPPECSLIIFDPDMKDIRYGDVSPEEFDKCFELAMAEFAKIEKEKNGN
jgi:hypothetical protein